MTDLNLFRIEPDFVPIDKENEFYDISDDIVSGQINSEVVIEEDSFKVLKIMFCKQSWIDKYYEEPLKEYENPPPTNENMNLENNNNNKIHICPKSCESICKIDCSTARCSGCYCPRIYICGYSFCPTQLSCDCCDCCCCIHSFFLGIGICILVTFVLFIAVIYIMDMIEEFKQL